MRFFLLLLNLISFIVSLNYIQNINKGVSYDERALLIDGKRQLLMVATVHYPRTVPSQWRTLMKKIKNAGLNAIDTYIFWDYHEPERGQYEFTPETNKDVKQFLRIAHEEGLYVVLRYGPYVCAEWNYGGFPVWLKEIPGIEFRTYNKPFMQETTRFLDFFVEYTRDLFYQNGGPIVLLQVENEYGMIESDYGADGQKYINWIADYALNLNTSVPWIMCQQNNVPQLINTCNGFYCDKWQAGERNITNQVGMFTEHWTGWFLAWGGIKPTRPAEDIAYSVARFIAVGGTYNAYYMWHGGTNFGRTVGVDLVTSYDYDAPLDEYMFDNEPKVALLKELHSVLFKFADVITGQNEIVSLKPMDGVEIQIYGDFQQSPDSVMFISNLKTEPINSLSVNGTVYDLPAWSVFIIQGPANDQKLLFCTADSKADLRKYKYEPVFSDKVELKYSFFEEPTVHKDLSQFSSSPLEQIRVTRDKTDYLWYINPSVKVIPGVRKIKLRLENAHDHVIVFWDGQYVGTSRGKDIVEMTFYNSKHTLKSHTLSILTQTLGLTNFGAHRERWSRGLTGKVYLNDKDITLNGWYHEPGLKGEKLKLYEPEWLQQFKESDSLDQNRFKWIRIEFPIVDQDTSVYDNQFAYVLDLASMGKGSAWVNGHHIGRYWNITGQLPDSPTNPYPPTFKINSEEPNKSSNDHCPYYGEFQPDKCRDRSQLGEPTQRYYHVPQEWLNGIQSGDDKNVIVLFEEEGGDLSRVKLLKVSKEDMKIKDARFIIQEDIGGSN